MMKYKTMFYKTSTWQNIFKAHKINSMYFPAHVFDSLKTLKNTFYRDTSALFLMSEQNAILAPNQQDIQLNKDEYKMLLLGSKVY